MVSVCMFHQLSSPASARACLVPRNIHITIQNLTSLGGSSAGFLIQALSRPAQKGCCTSFNGFQSQLFLMLREAVAAQHPFLLLRSPRERTVSSFLPSHSLSPRSGPMSLSPHQLWVQGAEAHKGQSWTCGSRASSTQLGRTRKVPIPLRQQSVGTSCPIRTRTRMQLASI